MLDAGRRLGAQQLVHVLADLVHVEARLGGRARGPGHRVDQRGEPVGLADDDCGVFLQSRRRQLALQQLRRAAQPAERVLDLVRELANHEAAAVQAREQVVLARDALALRGVGELQQQLRAGEPGERGDGDVERAHLARRPGRAHRDLAVGDALAALERAPQDAAEPFGVMQEVAERAAARLLQAEGQQVLRGDVGVHRAQLRIEHHDAGGERIEQVRGIEVRERGRGGLFKRHDAPATRAAPRARRPRSVRADGVGGIA